MKERKKLGIALVGLGQYSEEQLAPALQQTQYCQLAGIVTGTPKKAERWKDKYEIPAENIYNYDNFDSIKDNPDIDIVYVVLPNALHAEYVIRAAKAGKHVICEKPMAVSEQECEAMIQACKEAGTLLSIGYRLHFEPYNQEMMTFAAEKTFGKIKAIQAENGKVLEESPWRARKPLSGGGPLMDMGIYCIQGALNMVGQMPIAVTAIEGTKTRPERFTDVEESISWILEFEGGIRATCRTSYTAEMDVLKVEADKGWFQLVPANAYDGIKGETSEGKMMFAQISEQVIQMDDFARCVMYNTPSRVSGEMGLRDVKIIMAVYEAAKTGKRILLN